MRNLIIYLSALTSLSITPVLGMRHGSRQLRDMLAFPKYQVEFMNELPLSHSDAERCRAMGVEDEDEFTKVRFEGRDRRAISESEIGGSGSAASPGSTGTAEGVANGSPNSKLELIPMKLPSLDGTYEHNYLCLMPSENSTLSQMTKEEEPEEVDPAQGWAALSHLEGKCLYTKQGWFTYSYCHNSHIRQFRQAPHQHPHPPGGFVPQEDTRYEAYTLGQVSPPPGDRRGSGGNGKRKPSLPGQAKAKNARPDLGTPNPDPGTGSPATSIDRLNHDHAVSYGLQPSSRYLVQRWSDGTRCDKTFKPREIEVQLHCSMTTTDTIYLIKELSICQYVMIIHTPHLCGLPGFRADHTPVDEARVRCREVIGDEDFEKWTKGEEVEMPFLTIGKEGHPLPHPDSQLSSGSGSDSDNDRDGGEGRGGSFPWPAGTGAGQGLGVGQDSKPTKDDMKLALGQLGDYIKKANGDGVDGQEQEVLFFTLDDGEDGGGEPIIIEAEVLDGQGVDRDMVMKLVKEYLRNKDKGKDKGQGQDENSDKTKRGLEGEGDEEQTEGEGEGSRVKGGKPDEL